MARNKGVWTPLELEKQVAAITESLDKIQRGKYSYREAHRYVREDRRDAHRHDDNAGLKVSGGDMSDPVLAIVTSQMGNRERLRQVGELLDQAATAIDTAAARVRAVFSSSDDYYQPLESYRP